MKPLFVLILTLKVSEGLPVIIIKATVLLVLRTGGDVIGHAERCNLLLVVIARCYSRCQYGFLHILFIINRQSTINL